jgi:hypothetical protein
LEKQPSALSRQFSGIGVSNIDGLAPLSQILNFVQFIQGAVETSLTLGSVPGKLEHYIGTGKVVP